MKFLQVFGGVFLALFLFNGYKNMIAPMESVTPSGFSPEVEYGVKQSQQDMFRAFDKLLEEDEETEAK
jgi:hypothetical protein